MENVKYILIVSQFYYSHHCFVVSPKEENFREKALTLIEKLEAYKRGGGDYGEYRYGYSREKAYTDVNARWNVNDAGDIYFIPCPSILSALNHAEDYNSEVNFLRKYKGYSQKHLNKIDTDICRNHSYCAVRDIVGSVFEIL